MPPLYLFFFLLHAYGVMVFHLFPVMDIGVMALYVATAVVLGVVVLQVENKMVPTMISMAMTNETCHGAPSKPAVKSLSKGG